MEPIDALLTGWTAAGVWATEALPDRIDDRATPLGWTPVVVDDAVPTKEAFLAALRRAARFPHWVGNNWDAFEDAITDLSWLPDGDLLIVVAPPVPDIAVDILVDAARFWDRRGRRFAVVVAGSPLEGRAALLPRLDHLPMLGQSPPRRSSGQ